MKFRRLLLATSGLVLGVFAVADSRAADLESLQRQVFDAETAFAQTMADRDFEAFKQFLADETVFFSGGEPILGAQAVAEHWNSFYREEEPPFSWAPETVVVLESGELAHSSGPVFNSSGERFATYNSVWRREPNGQWKVVFDKGCAWRSTDE